MEIIKKIDFIKILIFLSFCISILSSVHNLSNFDKNISDENGKHSYHQMIKTDALRHFKHGAEIIRDLSNGINYFKAGRASFDEYLPARLVVAYYFFFDLNSPFNNWEEKKIQTGVHLNYLIIQCAIYYLSLLFLYSVISKQIPKKVSFFIILFLGLEPTIFQYHGTFWSESIFFSLQIILLTLVINNKTNVINFFLIGIFSALLAIDRSPAIYYIIPIIIYFLFIIKKKFYPKIIFILIGYIFITAFTGYHNFVRSGYFYIIPNEVRANLHLYLLPNILNDEEKKNEKKIIRNWISTNVEIKNEYLNEMNKISTHELSTHEFCEQNYLKTERDKVKYCNYLKSRAFKHLLEKPFITLKHIFYNSIHFPLLNPFNIYSDHRFPASEIYYQSPTHQKLIPYRIIYSMFIYIVSIFGLIRLYQNKDKKILSILIISVAYFFLTLSWHGNTRYFVPVLIYISFFFGHGCFAIINLLNQKIKK